MQVRMTRTVGLGVALLLSSAAPAQEATGSAERLRALLSELAGVDAKAWSARLAELEQQAKGHDGRADELRAQAAKLQQEADAAAAAAKTVRAEIERLKQLQALATGLPKVPANAAHKAAPQPAPKSEPKAEPKAEAPKKDTPSAMAVAEPAPSELVTWVHVAPIFSEHCASCHDPDDKEGGLDLTSFAAARQGGGSGQTIEPGEPEQSRLYRLITRQERPFMPRNADQLAAATLAKVKLWIEQGAAEDANSARAFLAKKDTAKKDTAAKLAAASHDADLDDGAAPMPAALPEVELRTPARAAALKSLARSPRAPLLALPGLQQVRLVDAELHQVGVLPCPLAHVAAVAFSADGKLVLAAGGDPGRAGRAVLYDVRTGNQLGEFGKEQDVPLAAAVDAHRGLVALGGSSKQVRVHRTSDGTLAFAGKHDDFVLGLDFSRHGEWLAAADRSGVVKVWDTATGRVEQTLTGHRGAVHSVAFLRGGKLLASVGADGTLRIWDVAEGKEKWRQTAHQGEALAVAVGPEDAVATCGSDGRIRLFSAQGAERGASAPMGEWLYSVAFGADGKTVFAGDWQGRTHRFVAK